MDQFKQVLDTALVKLKEQEAHVAETKKVINTICGWAGQPPMFPDAEPSTYDHARGFRKDQFYGQPLSTVVRQILEARKAGNSGPASVSEIYEAMIAGGYKFETTNEDNAKRALRISLTKNTAIFHKIPSGEYGLRAWYPNVREPKAKSSAGDAATSESTIPNAESEGFDFENKENELDPATKSA